MITILRFINVLVNCLVVTPFMVQTDPVMELKKVKYGIKNLEPEVGLSVEESVHHP